MAGWIWTWSLIIVNMVNLLSSSTEPKAALGPYRIDTFCHQHFEVPVFWSCIAEYQDAMISTVWFGRRRVVNVFQHTWTWFSSCSSDQDCLNKVLPTPLPHPLEVLLKICLWSPPLLTLWLWGWYLKLLMNRGWRPLSLYKNLTQVRKNNVYLHIDFTYHYDGDSFSCTSCSFYSLWKIISIMPYHSKCMTYM